MKLTFAKASPFARKPLILLHELNLLDQVELLSPGPVTPVTENELVEKANPLGMIPVLVLDDGQSVYDSCVICEYLNHFAQGDFYPPDPNLRLQALQLQSLADGIMDISVALRYETAIRPEELRWQEWIDQQGRRVKQALLALEPRVKELQGQFRIGEVALACALGYRDFRFAEQGWRQDCPALSDWFAEVSERPSVNATVPD